MQYLSRWSMTGVWAQAASAGAGHGLRGHDQLASRYRNSLCGQRLLQRLRRMRSWPCTRSGAACVSQTHHRTERLMQTLALRMQKREAACRCQTGRMQSLAPCGHGRKGGAWAKLQMLCNIMAAWGRSLTPVTLFGNESSSCAWRVPQGLQALEALRAAFKGGSLPSCRSAGQSAGTVWQLCVHACEPVRETERAAVDAVPMVPALDFDGLGAFQAKSGNRKFSFPLKHSSAHHNRYWTSHCNRAQYKQIQPNICNIQTAVCLAQSYRASSRDSLKREDFNWSEP